MVNMVDVFDVESQNGWERAGLFTSCGGEELEKDDDFVYFGSRIMRTEKDLGREKLGERAINLRKSGSLGCVLA